MKIVLLLVLFYSCQHKDQKTELSKAEISKKVDFINSTILAKSKEPAKFLTQKEDCSRLDWSSFDWNEAQGQCRGKRKILNDSNYQIFQLIDRIKRDSAEDIYIVYFIDNKVAHISSHTISVKGYAVYHIDGSTILRKDEQGQEIDGVKNYVLLLNEEAARFNNKHKKQS